MTEKYPEEVNGMMRRFEGVRTPSLLFSRSFSEAEKTQLCSLESCF
jgi:hypothetical protein